MIGAIFAYLYGKSRGRQEQRRDDQKRRDPTPSEVRQQELARLVICIVIGIAVVWAIFGH